MSITIHPATIDSPLLKQLNGLKVDNSASQDHPFPKASKLTTKHLPPPADQLTPEGKPIGVAPAAIPQDGYRPQWINTGPPVERIVEMISRYLYRSSPEDQFESSGREFLKGVVSHYVDANKKIELVFPGFPFKSPGKNRVLGVLPDFAEELLLRRLEMLALSIQDYHPPGAVIRIVSDGVVYGEILEQSDAVVYRYNSELRRLISEFGLTHITFVRVADLLDPTSGVTEDKLTEEEYVSSIPSLRARFLAHVVPGFDVEEALKTDIGVSNTYRGYVKFLADGFAASKDEQELGQIAKSMLKNGAIFSDLVEKKFPDAVRISCHAHNNAGPKFAFDMFPGAARAASAWHNAVLQKADGSFEINHVHKFDSNKYEVVTRYGRPYYLREPTPELDFGEKINPHVSFIPNIPYGLIIKADPAAGLSFRDLDMQKIRALSIRHSVVLMQGFSLVDEEEFVKVSEGMGEVIPWNSLGPVVKLKEDPGFDMNSTLTCESMPMHYDGLFKAKVLPSGEITNDPPLFQMFQCIHAPGGGEGGRTMVTNGADVLKYGLTTEQREWLSTRRSISFTPKNQAFGGNLVNMPLIMRNEHTGHDCIRWLESWPQHVTKFNPIECIIADVPPSVSEEIGEYLTDLLYDRRFCYAHAWTTGDILIAENIETLHNRTAFLSCPRELWRIHIN